MQMQTACRYRKYRSVSLLPVLGLLVCPNGSARNPSSKVPAWWLRVADYCAEVLHEGAAAASVSRGRLDYDIGRLDLAC